jgi:hypothetical protein
MKDLRRERAGSRRPNAELANKTYLEHRTLFRHTLYIFKTTLRPR